MDSELDRTFDKLDNQSNEEFEAFLDSWYEAREAEYTDAMMARLELQDLEMRGEIGDF